MANPNKSIDMVVSENHLLRIMHWATLDDYQTTTMAEYECRAIELINCQSEDAEWHCRVSRLYNSAHGHKSSCDHHEYWAELDRQEAERLEKEIDALVERGL